MVSSRCEKSYSRRIVTLRDPTLPVILLSRGQQDWGCCSWLLIVSLLKSDSIFASEAAAGLLREISGVSLYRDAVAESGPIEEIAGLLIRCLANSDDHVLEHCICTLWNLSVDEKHRAKIADSKLLPLMVKCLRKEDMRVKEAAGGVLANLALSHQFHGVMVEAGVIPKLVG